MLEEKSLILKVVEAGKSKSATLALDILPGGTEGATYAVAVSAVATAGTERLVTGTGRDNRE